MAASADLQRIIADVLDEKREDLSKINLEIWGKPEQSYQEFHAHDVITAFLKDNGFVVEEKFLKETGFRAQFCVPQEAAGDAAKGLNICFICQYDGVADLGHAAGHNLQTVGSLAAALGIKSCLEKQLLRGKVTVLGTPGDDTGSGSKIDMLNSGVFTDIDLCLMLTPLNHNILYPKYYNLVVVDVNYKGKASHASAFPWDGRNALDAAVACYSNIALLRQQLKPNWSINGIISEGGVQPNVIPASSQLKFWLRAPDDRDLMFIQQKCTACFVAAAKATGCESDFSFVDKPNLKVNHNTTLGEIYKHHAHTLGFNFSEDPDVVNAHIGSTDMGNVSQEVPCIMPAFDIGTKSPIHSEAFCKAAGTEDAFSNTLLAAKALTFATLDMFCCPRTSEAMKDLRRESVSVSAEILERASVWERQASQDQQQQ